MSELYRKKYSVYLRLTESATNSESDGKTEEKMIGDKLPCFLGENGNGLISVADTTVLQDAAGGTKAEQ